MVHKRAPEKNEQYKKYVLAIISDFLFVLKKSIPGTRIHAPLIILPYRHLRHKQLQNTIQHMAWHSCDCHSTFYFCLFALYSNFFLTFLIFSTWTLFLLPVFPFYYLLIWEFSVFCSFRKSACCRCTSNIYCSPYSLNKLHISPLTRHNGEIIKRKWWTRTDGSSASFKVSS